MADSNITKRALAVALRELMSEVPFEKINVAHICEKCDMNRKSFYYHFRDKYDLVNWIFDTEFIDLVRKQSNDRWELISLSCNYFYENRDFYCKALQIKGQNSFSEHFREFMQPLIHARIEEIMGQKDVPRICVDFFADGIICTIERWLIDKECMPPEQFVAILRSIVQSTAKEVCRNLD